MIIKERQIPLRIKEINALLNRLSAFHPKRSKLEEELKNRWTGYRGETQTDYYLEFLDNENYLIFNGLRLVHQKHAFQIDTLIISLFFILIIEIKNISGTISFEKNSSQVTRKFDDKEQGFQNPLVQVNQQKKQLAAWLKKQKLPSIPIEDLVVFSDRKTILKTTNDNYHIFKKILYADTLVEKMKQFEAIHKWGSISGKHLQKLKKLLLKEHTPAPPTLLQSYGINKSELMLGVQCPNCLKFPLIRLSQKWYCTKCHTYSKNSHKQAIIDYFLIVDVTISNTQCREFLMIESPDMTKKLLLRMKLPTSGSNKNRLYQRPPDL